MDADDLISTLRRQPNPHWVHAERIPPPKQSHPPPPPTVAGWRRYVMPLLIAWGLIGPCVATQTAKWGAPDPPVVTVTVTQTVPAVAGSATRTALPPACGRALELTARIMADTHILSGSYNAQIDLAREANRAILEKDWRALNDVQERQLKLKSDQQDANVDFMTIYQEALTTLAKCQKEVGGQ